MNFKPSTPLLFPLILVLYEIATYLSNDMYLPALPEMMLDLGLSTKQAQLTLTTWFLGSASMPLIMGMLTDRLGRRNVLLTGGLIYILACVVGACSPSMSVLMLSRVVQGAMIPSMMVAGYACIHELYEQKEAIRILALMGSISVLAPAFGPLLGSLILTVSTWRGIFVFIALFASFTLFLLYLWMPETHPKDKRLPIHMGTLFRNYARVVTNRRFMLLMLVLGFIFCGFLSWVTAGPLLVIVTFHHSAMVFGWIQAGVFIAYIMGNRWVKYLLAWLGIQKLIRYGLITILLGGMAVLGSAFIFPDSLAAFLIGMTLYSVGSALCFAPLNRLIIETSNEPMGIRVAIFSVFITGFAALGSALASLFFNGSVLSLASLVALSSIIACLMKVIAR